MLRGPLLAPTSLARAIALIAPLAACSLVSLDALDGGAGGGATSTASATSTGTGANGTGATSASGAGGGATTSGDSTNVTAPGAGAGGSSGSGGSGGSGGGPTASQYAAAVMASGPIVFLRLGETNEDELARDEMGNHDGYYRLGALRGLPGALSGDPSTSVAPSTDLVPHGAVDVTDVLDFAEGTAPFSIELWILIDDPPIVGNNYEVLVNKDEELTAGDRVGYLLGLWPMDGRHWALGFERLAVGSESLGLYAFDIPVTMSAWHHVAATFHGGGAAIYLDGEDIISSIGSSMPLADTGAPLLIGSSSLGNYPFAGVIDEVAIYDRALGPTEVEDHYKAGTGQR